jgi:hypothetical protein
MIQAKVCELLLTVSGCTRDELRDAFRGSQWESQLESMWNPVDRNYYEMGFSLSLPITNWRMLVEGVKCIGTLKPEWSSGLYVSAVFPTGTMTMHVSEELDAEEGPTCRFRLNEEFKNVTPQRKLADAQGILSQVIDILGMQEGGA